MRRLISYMFTSLDGFIADRDGGLDWMPFDDELMRFANDYFRGFDGIVFGRNVYDGFVSYWDGLDDLDPSVTELEVEFAGIFGAMQRIVASRTITDVPDGTVLIGDDVPSATARLKEQPGRDLMLICGPELRSTLAAHALIDQYRSHVAPIVLGEGVPLFAPMTAHAPLRLLDSSAFSDGVVMLDHVPR